MQPYNNGSISALFSTAGRSFLPASPYAFGGTRGLSGTVESGSSSLYDVLSGRNGSQTVDLFTSFGHFTQQYAVKIKSNAADLRSTLRAMTGPARDTDANSLREGVQSIVQGFNGLLGAVDGTTGASNSLGGGKLLRDLGSLASAYGSSLAEVGISIGSAGYMSLDEDKLNAAIESGAAERFFAARGNVGFANGLARVANDIAHSPAKYVKDVFPNVHYIMNAGALLQLSV